MYEAILFDFDGTLTDFEACEVQALKEAFCGAGFDADGEASWAAIWQAYAPISASYWRRRDKDGWTRAQVTTFIMRDTLAALDAQECLAPTLAAAYWDAFCRTWALNPGAREVLDGLAPHYKLGLVTNGDKDAQRGRLKAAGLDRCFQAIVISDEVGYAKPAREVFERALSALGVTARETLFIGDSIAHDYQGARNAGIDFCYYQPDPEAHPELHPTFRVSHLLQLARILLG